MVSVIDLVLFGVVLGIHTLIAAVLNRFFRLRLNTRWGATLYTLLIVPVVLLVTSLVFTGVLNIGFDLGTPATALVVTIALPMILGVSIDEFYVPPPEEYELPESQ